jgi:hypothetical protein
LWRRRTAAGEQARRSRAGDAEREADQGRILADDSASILRGEAPSAIRTPIQGAATE